MIPVTQTKMHDPDNGTHGNCLAAAMASVLEIPLSDIPAFEEMSEESWHDSLLEFLYGRGYDVDVLQVPPAGYGIAHGMGPRGVHHSVVVLDGEFIHDPHPSGLYLDSIDCYWQFTNL